jgi:hypothetical protein
MFVNSYPVDEITLVSCMSCESDSASGKEGVTVLRECESGSEGGDSDNTAWVKVDKTHILGQFTGNPGMKQIPSHPTEVSETVDLFFWR